MDPSSEGGAQPFFTLGHSTRPIEEFVALAASADVRLIVDVRTVPRSARNPQYNADSLPHSRTGLVCGMPGFGT